MTAIKGILGLFVFVMLAGSIFATSIFGGNAYDRESQVFVEQDETGRVLTISVIAFNPAQDQVGTNVRDVMNDIIKECKSEGAQDLSSCINKKSIERTSSSSGYQVELKSVEGAKVNVLKYNPLTASYTAVPTCTGLITNDVRAAYDIQGNEIENFYVKCDLTDEVTGAKSSTFRIEYVNDGQDQENIAPSSTSYKYENNQVSNDESFTNQLNNFISGMSGGGNGAVPTLPCVGIFLILGLLLSSLYFAGKSPISLLDITTPRLPAPKGVTAGGQMLMPFGYAEMTRTSKAKQAAAAAALGTVSKGIGSRMSGDSERRSLHDAVDSMKVAKEHVASGDVKEQKQVMKSIIDAGRESGMSKAELKGLTSKLLYDYGEAEHRTVAQILDRLNAKGGKHSLMGATIQDYIIGQKQMKNLEAISGHIDIGKRSYFQAKTNAIVGKAFGINRYSIVGGFVPGMLASAGRVGFGPNGVMGRMAKASIKEAPAIAASTARSTMQLVGGKRAIEELEHQAKDSKVAAWVAGSAGKNPASVVIGQAFPVSDKAGFFYKQLRQESHNDAMVYTMKQIYKKMGVNFQISEAELAQMGHVDMDILKRAGYKPSNEMHAMEAELRTILSNKSLGSLEKLNALTALAEKHGAHLDHNLGAFTARVEAIHASDNPDHVKMILMQEELERQNKLRGVQRSDDAFVTHVGGDNLRGPAVWETMVLRTMLFDAEHGHLQGGIKEELLSARLNVANRLASLDPTKGMEQLPEHMRSPSQLAAVAERNRSDIIQLFSEDGKKAFAAANGGKSMSAASMDQIVAFMYGGGDKHKQTGTIDPKTGKMMWWGADQEHGLPSNYALVDVKRHWVSGLSAQENFAIGQWVESRFTRSYVPAARASIEAELDRMKGSANWSVEERAQQAKKLWVVDELGKDMMQRFNSQFNNNTYGSAARETSRFYVGVMAGFLEKGITEKGLSNNHPDLMFLGNMDHSNPQHLSKLKDLMNQHHDAYQKVATRDVTYDDIAKTNKAMVMLHEGGFAYYNKNMMLSDADRIMGGQVSLRDNHGQLRAFVPDEVSVKFDGRDDLMAKFAKARNSTDPNEWHNALQAITSWAKEGGYNYEREKVLGAVVWQYSNQTHDYERFWKGSAVTIEAKREVAPVAPSFLRFFGVEGHRFDTVIKPFNDIGLHGGDYISKVALAAGGPLLNASYEITPTSEYYRQHSWKLSERIMSGRDMQSLSEEERVAYRNVAMQHGAYHQVWDYAIDRNPWRTSTAYGATQNWASFFHFGPAANFKVRDNLGAYLDRAEYASFMALYGFPMDLAGKMMHPYINTIRGMQMSMQGYASKWDQRDDALRQWNHTQPRLREAMQSLNPFSYRWFSGKTSENIAKLNVFGGSLEQHQLAGPEYVAGLRQAPQDIFLQRKGVYASARTGEANPAASFYNYRHELQFDAPMAEYLYRQKTGEFMFDKKVTEAAMANTQTRTVSAEALALNREQQLRGFGVMQNPLFGWANPVAFLWHAPIPLMPSSATPKDIVANMIKKHKTGHGESWEDTIRGVSESVSRGAKDLASPHLLHRVAYCPKCSRSGYRGSRCSCGQPLY